MSLCNKTPVSWRVLKAKLISVKTVKDTPLSKKKKAKSKEKARQLNVFNYRKPLVIGISHGGKTMRLMWARTSTENMGLALLSETSARSGLGIKGKCRRVKHES